MNPIDDGIQERFFSNAHKKKLQDQIENPKPVFNELSEKQSMEIFNDLLNVYLKYNISYRAATQIAMAMAHAFLTGAIELYGDEE